MPGRANSARLTALVVVCQLMASVEPPAQAQAPAFPPDPRESVASVVRLSPDHQERFIRDGDSILAKSTREAFWQGLQKLQGASDSLLDEADVWSTEALDPGAWVSTRTAHWPERAPDCERAILAVLASEVEVLDTLLWLENQDQAETLRQGRRQIRLLRPDQRVFGDVRDQFVAAVLQRFREISRLQTTLGSAGASAWSFPDHLQTAAEVETYLVRKLRVVVESAYALSESAQ